MSPLSAHRFPGRLAFRALNKVAGDPSSSRWSNRAQLTAPAAVSTSSPQAAPEPQPGAAVRWTPAQECGMPATVHSAMLDVEYSERVLQPEWRLVAWKASGRATAWDDSLVWPL